MPESFANGSAQVRPNETCPNPNPNPNPNPGPETSLKGPYGTYATTIGIDEGFEGLKREALRAIDARDWKALEPTGWIAVFDHLRFGWPPTRGGSANRIDPKEARAWIVILGDIPADRVRAALDEWTARGETIRPFPSQIRDVIVGRPDLTDTDEAFAAVRQAIRYGERPCACDGTDRMTSRTNVIRCADCGGLDRDQHNRATEGSQR